MKRIVIGATIFLALFSACVPKARLLELESQLDSLSNVNAIYEEDLLNMNLFIDELAESIDSISSSESILLLTESSRGKSNSRYQMLNNLSEFEALLERQKKRIAVLDSIISVKIDSTSTLRILVSNYREQINAKELDIKDLRRELSAKKKHIVSLEAQVTTMSDEIKTLNEDTSQLEEILKNQTEYINKGYFLVVTRKDLKALGAIKGINKIDLSLLPLDIFNEIDIREFNELTISSSSIKLLSTAPADSYRIERNLDKTCTLVITDASAFWSISSYLVIQI